MKVVQGCPDVSAGDEFMDDGRVCLFRNQEGAEHNTTAGELRQGILEKRISEDLPVRQEGQDFCYSAAEWLGLRPAKPVLFMCHVCQGQVSSRHTEMQRYVPCPGCGSMVQVPDRRPLAERQKSQQTKVALAAANARIAQGLFLAGCSAGVFMLAFTDFIPGLVVPCALGLGAAGMVWDGFSKRSRLFQGIRGTRPEPQD